MKVLPLFYMFSEDMDHHDKGLNMDDHNLISVSCTVRNMVLYYKAEDDMVWYMCVVGKVMECHMAFHMTHFLYDTV